MSGGEDQRGAGNTLSRPENFPIQLVSEGNRVPFSKGLLATTLTATGLPPERAFGVAMDVEWQLLQGPDRDVSVDRLRELVESVLAESEGQRYLQRYRTWNRLAREDRPVIVLIGGATGVGKSTIAAQVADRLGVVRIISTDSIREVMRAFFSESLMPAIHYSSYEADKAVRIPLGPDFDSHVVGFMEQVEMVNVGVLAVLDRSIKEHTSLVVEGVHIVPGMLASAAARERMEDALFLPMVVAVSDPKLHRSHFLVREQETSGRRVLARYLKGFEEIRKIQDFILERAETEGTLVVDNVSIDDTVGTLVDALYDLIEQTEGQNSGGD
ncbi:MAG: zeta toxin family protein [bacterium]